MNKHGLVLAALAAAALAGCQSMTAGGPQIASAGLAPTKDSKVMGEVTFEQMGDKVRVVAQIIRLPAGKEFGFHIHEVGDCGSGDGMSAGGHFNPQGKPHGQGMSRHAGDLPNLKSDAKGKAKLSVDVDMISVTPGPASVVGRGIIVHAQPDDYATQPTGNAGARMACGVIKAN